ncbi:GNAT family N-acetyltransferase [Sphingobium nicotianae]|uniref:GNAT family N-acetyltransferase n=1 Tax=Sphingobium nicotianae TaxID=2782607 RepID=A0A9X1IRG8_9SPHN|nr:GNAT family N-acetyltransferase [Sphingobium nicotianae]MBT2187200.1 GNAT family N-acetyltransferase [Sphingobium nicotianae]
MKDIPISTRLGNFDATTDRTRIELGAALELLKTTHWATSLTLETLALAVANSLTFGLLQDGALVAFGRIVTDRSTFAYLTDVVVAGRMRGKGIGERFTGWMLLHPDLTDVRRVTLLTRDAAALYRKLGFREGSSLTFMERMD